MWWGRGRSSRYRYRRFPDSGSNEQHELHPPPFKSTSRPVIKRRLFALLLFGVFLLGGSFGGLRQGYRQFTSERLVKTPEPFEIELERVPHLRLQRNASALDDAQHEAFRMFRRPQVQCLMQSWHITRYSSLYSSLRSLSVLLALNLKNAEEMLPNMLLQLPVLLKFLGPWNVHVHVYESGSDDTYTQRLLISLGQILDAAGTSYTIVSRGTTEATGFVVDHHIDSLAKLRNKLLSPLFDEAVYSNMPRRKFDEVLFMNDIIWCPVDVLEVLYQKRQRGAHQSCSVDWDWNMPVIYDRWVLRTMTGSTWYNRTELMDYWDDDRPKAERIAPVPLAFDLEDRPKFKALQPLQVFSCWNGISAISASAFVDLDIRFRTALSDHYPDGSPKEPTDIASECYLLSVDLWKKGLGKIVLASRSRVAYTEEKYEIYRTDQESTIGTPAVTESFEWKTSPPAQVAMQDLGWWRIPERWAPWDEA